MGVSENSGFPPKSSILIGISTINRPFWDTHIFGKTHMMSLVPSHRNDHMMSFFVVGYCREVTI